MRIRYINDEYGSLHQIDERYGSFMDEVTILLW